MLEYYKLFLELVARVTGYIVTILMALMTIIVVAAVFMRYVLLTGLPWAEELSRYLMIWSGFLGASLAVRMKANVGIEFVVKKLPGRWNKLSRIFSQIAVMIFLVYVTKIGFDTIIRISKQLSPMMEISMAWPYAAIPISGALMILHLLEQIIHEITPKQILQLNKRV